MAVRARAGGRSKGLTRAEIIALCKQAGVDPPKAPSKYGANWTYFNGRTLHTTGRDCAPLQPTRCPICSDLTIKADRKNWYQSRVEAQFAAKCDQDQRFGRIRAHARSATVVLVPGNHKERVTYTPDRDIWVTNDPGGPCDYRAEVKGSRAMMSQQSIMRVKMYRDAARRGEQPPLIVVNGKGEEIKI